MRYTILACIIGAFAILTSCSETTHVDNTTHNADTMVIKQNQTDSATNTISKDTTKR